MVLEFCSTFTLLLTKKKSIGKETRRQQVATHHIHRYQPIRCVCRMFSTLIEKSNPMPRDLWALSTKCEILKLFLC